MINQVNNIFQCKLSNLKKYKQRVGDLIESFKAFNITLIPREINTITDALATSATTIMLLDQSKHNGFTIKVVHCPLVPDNVENLQVFFDDVQIIQFLTNTDIF